jgi:hypothetical protein
MVANEIQTKITNTPNPNHLTQDLHALETYTGACKCKNNCHVSLNDLLLHNYTQHIDGYLYLHTTWV